MFSLLFDSYTDMSTVNINGSNQHGPSLLHLHSGIVLRSCVDFADMGNCSDFLFSEFIERGNIHNGRKHAHLFRRIELITTAVYFLKNH